MVGVQKLKHYSQVQNLTLIRYFIPILNSLFKNFYSKFPSLSYAHSYLKIGDRTPSIVKKGKLQTSRNSVKAATPLRFKSLELNIVAKLKSFKKSYKPEISLITYRKTEMKSPLLKKNCS